MQKNKKGFTLVELMVVITIIGILAGIAYPSYMQHVKKAACADGVDVLLEQAGFMEECLLNNDTYESATALRNFSAEGNYEMSITASPVDTSQHTLTLNSLNQKGESGGAPMRLVAEINPKIV